MATALSSNAQTQATDTVLNVEQTIIRFFNGISALDWKVMETTTTDNFLLLEDGAVWNMDSLVTRLSPLKSMSFSRVNQLKFIEQGESKNAAWAAYHNTADIKVNGREVKLEWMESAFLIKENGAWKIRLLHSTKLN